MKNAVYDGKRFKVKTYFITGMIFGMTFFPVGIRSATPAGVLMFPQADNKGVEMPIRWGDAHSRLIPSPDRQKLEQGEIFFAREEGEGDNVIAQTLSLIKTPPESCYRIVREYNQYRSVMPYTAESRVIRSFRVTAEGSEREGVDFWTRVNVLGFETRYLIRIVHLEDPRLSTYRSYWTLVEKPSVIPECVDSENRPCENDLSVNVGSHLFEPYAPNPHWTLHTYTVRIGGKHWYQRTAVRWGGARSMGDVVRRLREVAGK